MIEDDEVGFDLSAWEAPPPPNGIADAVVAQMRMPDAKPAVEPAPARKLRWWMIAAPLVAASVIGAVAISLAGGSDEVSGSGAVATAKPSHLELGGTAVDLDANTDVWWVRDGKRMVAMQPRGTATWKVAAGDELVIDAGATVASVKASGASLRVEVEMNLSDARLIGTSAVTAAAVALVTIIVYEGRVEVTGGDKTVQVAAGSTVEIAPNKPPVEPVRSAADQIAGLEKRLRSEIDFLKLENELLRKQMVGTVSRPPAIDTSRYEKVIALATENCRVAGFKGKLAISIDIDDRGAPSDVRFDPEDAKPASCLKTILMRDVRFPDAPGGIFRTSIEMTEPRVASRPPKPPTVVWKDSSPFLPVVPPSTVDSTPACADKAWVADLDGKGDAAMNQGSFAQALVWFEKVLKCKPSVINKAYLAACRIRAFPKAKAYFKVINASGRHESWAQICMKEGFDPR